MKKYLLLIISFSIILLSSCGNSKPYLITDNKTIPPEWGGIVLGETSKSDLLAILHDDKNVNLRSIYSLGKPWNSFEDIVEFSLVSGEKGYAYIKDGHVMLIEFSSITRITFETMINYYGNPTYILKHQVLGKGYFFGDSQHVLIDAIYPEKGVIYGYDTSSILIFNTNKLLPKTKINWIDYFDPKDFSELSDLGMFSDGAPLNPELFYKWAGFGKISLLYP